MTAIEMTASEMAADAYRRRVVEICATVDRSSRAFAAAMSAACADYERAMVADVGSARAKRLGAGMVRL